MTDQTTTVKRAKPKSRPQRWADAAGECEQAIAAIEDKLGQFEEAVETLKELQAEYQEMLDNLPDNLRSSAYGEKLDEVCNLDLESLADNLRSAVDEASSSIGEAEAIDLPRGFGRD